MALTPRGVGHIWTLLAAELQAGGLIRIGEGDTAAEAPVTSASVEQGPELVVTATFGADQAVGDWKRTAVVLPTGTELDVEEEDLGRKAGGSDWSLTVKLRLKPAA
jgi:hypothetical protein